MAHELTDWYEEAERLRVERDALAARLVERDGTIAAFREAVQWFVGANTPPNGTCLYCPGHAAHEPWCPVAKVLAVVAAVPAPLTTAPPTAAERAVVNAAQRYRALRLLHGPNGGCYWIDRSVPTVEASEDELIAAVDALRAARGEASE